MRLHLAHVEFIFFLLVMILEFGLFIDIEEIFLRLGLLGLFFDKGVDLRILHIVGISDLCLLLGI